MSSVSDKLIRTDLSFEMSLFNELLKYKLKSARHMGLAPYRNMYQDKFLESNSNITVSMRKRC